MLIEPASKVSAFFITQAAEVDATSNNRKAPLIMVCAVVSEAKLAIDEIIVILISMLCV